MDTAAAEPDVIVLATKISDIHYGMQLLVVQVFGGTAQVGDTLMVWGDNGALCRIYAGAWSIGDTAVFALHNTDFMGNWIINSQYPPDVEQPGDFHISVCGVYSLNYSVGTVSGSIDGVHTTMELNDFSNLVTTCFLFTGMQEEDVPDFSLYTEDGQLVIVIPTDRTDRYQAVLHSSDGKSIRELSLQPGKNRTPLTGMASGIHVLRVTDRTSSYAKRVWLP